VLALGLLVDDAIIAVEMMAIKMEQGLSRVQAAAFAYRSTAFPMLTGTLVTAAGFLPIATAKSGTGEYTRSIFEVVALALLISWLAAVVLIPYLGYKLLPERGAAPGRFELLLQRWRERAWRLLPFARSRATGTASSGHSPLAPALSPHPGRGDESERGANAQPVSHEAHDPYATPFYRRFRALVDWCVGRRKTVIAATVLLFALSLVGFGFVQQQFFPDSTRPELLVERQVEARRAGADVTDVVLELRALGEPGFEFLHLLRGRGQRRALGQLDVDQELRPGRIREELLRHEAEQGDRQHERGDRGADHQPAMRQAPAEQRAEAAIERALVGIVVVRLLRFWRQGESVLRPAIGEALAPGPQPARGRARVRRLRMCEVRQHPVAQVGNEQHRRDP
jgi:multidrug efflux pump